jgi:chitooligosaccharide deacetylase
LVLGGGACLLAAGHLGTQGRPVRQGTADRVVKLRGIDPRAVSAVPADTSLVSLTFDDEPDSAHTPAALAILERFDVRATFFMIGRAAAQHPDLVRAVIAGGHTVANHTQDHLWLDRLDEQGVTQQVTRCSSTFTRLALPVTTLFRPPRGLTSPTVAAVTAAVEPRAYFWGTCLEANLRNLSPDGEASATACRFHPGAIILAPDGGHLDGPDPADTGTRSGLCDPTRPHRRSPSRLTSRLTSRIAPVAPARAIPNSPRT